MLMQAPEPALASQPSGIKVKLSGPAHPASNPAAYPQPKLKVMLGSKGTLKRQVCVCPSSF